MAAGGANPYKALLIGLGGRSRGHAEALRAVDDLDFVAGCDLTTSAERRMSRPTGSGPMRTRKKLWKKKIPTSPSFARREKPRYALARLAVEHGVRAVVLEKPMTANIREARDLVQLCKERDVVLTVMHQMRFSDEFVAAKEAIESGKIGKPYFVRAVSYGHLMEQGPHMVDMVLYLLGEAKAEWVMGQVADREEGLKTVHPSPAFVTGYVAFENGVRASFECGRRFPSAANFETEMEIIRPGCKSGSRSSEPKVW